MNNNRVFFFCLIFIIFIFFFFCMKSNRVIFFFISVLYMNSIILLFFLIINFLIVLNYFIFYAGNPTRYSNIDTLSPFALIQYPSFPNNNSYFILLSVFKPPPNLSPFAIVKCNKSSRGYSREKNS